jgi:hypothetical protein
MTEVTSFLTVIPWYAWIAIVAIVCGSATDMLKRRYRHLERLEMIRQGMHPDSGKPASACDV